MKEAFKTFKELWAIKRFRSLLKLGLYFIFMFFVIAVVRAGDNKVDPVPTTPSIIEYKDYNNYDFTYKIGDIKISGTTYNNEAVMYINGERYLYVNNILYYNADVVSSVFNDIDLILLIPSKLDTLLKLAILDSKVTYSDSIKYTYLLDGELYANYINSENEILSNVVIEVVKEDDLITKITFDNIEITYDNVGKVSGLNK